MPVPYADLTDPQSLNQYGYVRNIPTVRVDPDGHCCSFGEVADFVASTTNSYASDNLFGALRFESNTTAGKIGAAVGDAAATVQGVGETLLGATGEVGGLVFDVTGVGGIIGVPTNIVSAGVIIHGASTALNGISHLSKNASESGGGKGEDFSPSAKKEIDARDGNKCQSRGRDVRSVQNKKGQPTAADQRQRHHIKPKAEGGNGTAENAKTLCPDCHKKEHRRMRKTKQEGAS